MRYCLWGHRAGWVQVGSRTDRRLQEQLRLAATFQRFANLIGQAMIPAMEQFAVVAQRLGVAFADWDAALDRSRTW